MDQSNCGIYYIISPSQKIYIGKTKDFKDRMRRYRKGQLKSQRRLGNSFKKYGFEKHNIKLFFSCPENELNFWESFFIKTFNTFQTEYGLNLTSGGEGALFQKKVKLFCQISLKGERKLMNIRRNLVNQKRENQSRILLGKSHLLNLWRNCLHL